MEIINDEVMEAKMLSDLIETYNFTQDQASEWVQTNGASVVNDMWDAYSSYFQTYVTDQGTI